VTVLWLRFKWYTLYKEDYNKVGSDIKFQHCLRLHSIELENKKKFHGTVRNKNALKETLKSRNEIVNRRKELKEIDKA
jgi:hypothetical protein